MGSTACKWPKPPPPTPFEALMALGASLQPDEADDVCAMALALRVRRQVWLMTHTLHDDGLWFPYGWEGFDHD